MLNLLEAKGSRCGKVGPGRAQNEHGMTTTMATETWLSTGEIVDLIRRSSAVRQGDTLNKSSRGDDSRPTICSGGTIPTISSITSRSLTRRETAPAGGVSQYAVNERYWGSTASGALEARDGSSEPSIPGHTSPSLPRLCKGSLARNLLMYSNRVSLARGALR